MKIKLSFWLFLKTIPYLELLIYYYCLATQIFVPQVSFVIPLLLIITILLLWIFKKKRDILDEFAVSLLQKADAICLKAAFVIMILLLPATFVGGDMSGIIMGMMISGSMFALAVIRAVIFLIVDRNGL